MSDNIVIGATTLWPKMKPVPLRYRISRQGEYSDWLNWDVELFDDEAVIYQRAIEQGTSLNMVYELKGALARAIKEIEEDTIMDAIAKENDFVMECYGLDEVGVDVINALVAERDQDALAFFRLDSATDDELANWDAHELEELPWVRDFDPGFVECEPFKVGWHVDIEFVDV